MKTLEIHDKIQRDTVLELVDHNDAMQIILGDPTGQKRPEVWVGTPYKVKGVIDWLTKWLAKQR